MIATSLPNGALPTGSTRLSITDLNSVQPPSPSLTPQITERGTTVIIIVPLPLILVQMIPMQLGPATQVQCQVQCSAQCLCIVHLLLPCILSSQYTTSLWYLRFFHQDTHTRQPLRTTTTITVDRPAHIDAYIPNLPVTPQLSALPLRRPLPFIHMATHLHLWSGILLKVSS